MGHPQKTDPTIIFTNTGRRGRRSSAYYVRTPSPTDSQNRKFNFIKKGSVWHRPLQNFLSQRARGKTDPYNHFYKHGSVWHRPLQNFLSQKARGKTDPYNYLSIYFLTRTGRRGRCPLHYFLCQRRGEFTLAQAIQ